MDPRIRIQIHTNQYVMDPQHCCCQVLLPIILLMAWTTEQERTISWQVGLYLTILIVNLSNTTMIVLAVRNQESQGINGGERYWYSNSRQRCCGSGPFLSVKFQICHENSYSNAV
jgi:hypothetical protein